MLLKRRLLIPQVEARLLRWKAGTMMQPQEPPQRLAPEALAFTLDRLVLALSKSLFLPRVCARGELLVQLPAELSPAPGHAGGNVAH